VRCVAHAYSRPSPSDADHSVTTRTNQFTNADAIEQDDFPSNQRPRLNAVTRSLIQRVHNPRNRECGCDFDCWCRRTAVGRGVKWWFPARLFGLHHKNAALAQWKRDQDPSS